MSTATTSIAFQRAKNLFREQEHRYERWRATGRDADLDAWLEAEQRWMEADRCLDETDDQPMRDFMDAVMEGR